MKLRSKNDLPPDGLDMETLMEALFYRDEFLSIASHELKTPLTTIKLQAQVFKRNNQNDHSDAYSKISVDRMVNQIDQQTNRLIRLVNDMLDISRIRSGKLVMTKDFFDLTELVFEVCQQVGIPQIKINLEEKIQFWGDRERIAQVITKLLNNAAIYGKGLPIEVELNRKNKKIKLQIRDFGDGISKEDQIRILHRFQRAIAASEISGLGLGLYIAREIVEGHAGKISVKSELGEGATFCIDFNTKDFP